MENMLPLNFGVRTKGRIKANTLLNPAFWETFSVKYSLRKEIVHHHMGLHCIGVHILLHAVGGDHCYENGLSGSGLTDEGSDLVPEFLIIILVDDVWLGCPLHLADVDGVVPAVDEQVNLSPSLSRSQIFRVGTPGALFGHHSCNAQRGFDLPHMLKTYPLEGQAGPGALHARIEGMAPEGRVTAGLFDELVIEERVVVDKLEKGTFLLLADGGVLADEEIGRAHV